MVKLVITSHRVFSNIENGCNQRLKLTRNHFIQVPVIKLQQPFQELQLTVSRNFLAVNGESGRMCHMRSLAGVSHHYEGRQRSTFRLILIMPEQMVTIGICKVDCGLEAVEV
jgi:ABC-type thiamine transport system ATPase subunit